MDKHNNQIITNQELILQSENCVFLGPNLELIECTVTNKQTARNILFIDTQMIGGVFHTKKKLTNWQEHRVTFDGITFKGNFLGCDLGGRPDEKDSNKHYGLVKDCDFTQANMHLCRLFNADIASIQFARWPHFTIVNPLALIQQIKNLNLPNELTWSINPSDQPEGTTALIYNAEIMAKQTGIEVDVIKNLVSLIDGVIM